MLEKLGGKDWANWDNFNKFKFLFGCKTANFLQNCCMSIWIWIFHCSVYLDCCAVMLYCLPRYDQLLTYRLRLIGILLSNTTNMFWFKKHPTFIYLYNTTYWSYFINRLSIVQSTEENLSIFEEKKSIYFSSRPSTQEFKDLMRLGRIDNFWCNLSKCNQFFILFNHFINRKQLIYLINPKA